MRNWPQRGAVHIVDPDNTELAANVFVGTPSLTPQYLAVGVVEWAASAVVATQDSADGLIGGSTQPSYGIQLGWMNGSTFVAVSIANPLPVQGSGGGGSDVQYTEGTTVATATVTVAGAKDSSNVVHALLVDNTGALVVTGSGSNPSVGSNDTTAPTSSTQVGVQASDNLVALRTCDTFKTFQGQGGTPSSDPIWTPASGKKFRLMKLWITISGNAATSSGGLLTMTLTDGAAGPLVGPTIDVWIQPPTPTNAGGYFNGFLMDTGLIDMGNGYLSTGANTTLYLHCNLQFSTGYFRINTFGTEE